MANLSKKIIVILTLAIAVSALIIYLSSKLYQKSLFDEDSFLSKNYTISEIDFFSDISFWDSKWVRKWEADIKIQIDTINEVTESDIAEVDNIIKILSPLVAPLKMTIVDTDGNFIVHLNHLDQTIKGAKGWAKINDMGKPILIEHADIYVMKHYTQFLMHEFLHALGFWHPENEYPFYTAIGANTYVVLEAQEASSKYPDYGIVLNTWDEYDALYDRSYNNMSEQEKKAVKMLYSSDFKSGLSKKYFLKRLEKQKR